MLILSHKLSWKVQDKGCPLFCPEQKDKAVKDKKEDKKSKAKAKESTEAEANEENHSENGEAKTNAVCVEISRSTKYKRNSVILTLIYSGQFQQNFCHIANI